MYIIKVLYFEYIHYLHCYKNNIELLKILIENFCIIDYCHSSRISVKAKKIKQFYE